MKKTLFSLIFCFISYCTFSQNLSWQPVNADLGKNIKIIIPDSLNRLIIQSEKGVFIFSDLKDLKNIDDLLPDSTTITCLAIDTANNIYAGTLANGLYKYEEADKKWLTITIDTSIRNITNIAFNSDNQIAIRTKKNEFFLYSISGIKLKEFNKFYFDDYDQVYPLIFDKQNTLYTSIGGNLYELQPNDSIFQNINYASGSSRIKDIIITESCIYTGTESTAIFYKLFNGIRWKRMYEGIKYDADISKILFTSRDELIAVCKDKGIFYSNNQGMSFEENNSGLPVLNIITAGLMKNDNTVISLAGYGLFISEQPKNLPIKLFGWNKTSNFLERKAFGANIDEIKFTNDSKKIITRSSWELKIWDAETGYLLKEFEFQHKKDETAVGSISLDDSTIIFTKSTNIRRDTFSIENNIFSLNTGNLLYSTLVFDGRKTIGGPYEVSQVASKCDFNYSSKQLISAFSYNYWTPGGENDYNSLKGELNIKDLNDTLKKMIIINDYATTDFTFVDNINSILFLSKSFSSFGDDYYASYKLSRFDLNNNSISILDSCVASNNKPGVWLVSISLLKNNLLAGYYTDNKVVYWDIKNLQIKDSANFKRKPIDFQYSLGGNYIIAGYYNGFYIFSRLMKGIDSIPMPNNDYKWKIAVSPDSVSFAASSSDGMLRLLKSPILTTIQEDTPKTISVFQNLLITVFPNPASDFIEISYSPSIKRGLGGVSNELQVRIYNIFGQEFNPTPALPKGREFGSPPLGEDLGGVLNMDISMLPPGLYFVRIGEKVGKFVKI